MPSPDSMTPDSPYYRELWLGVSPSTPNKQNEVLLRFGSFLATIGASRIESAELRVYPYHQNSNNKWTHIRRITQDWSNGSVTWSNKPDTTALYGDDPYRMKTSEGSTAAFDVTDTVEAWFRRQIHQLRLPPAQGLGQLPLLEAPRRQGAGRLEHAKAPRDLVPAGLGHELAYGRRLDVVAHPHLDLGRQLLNWHPARWRTT